MTRLIKHYNLPSIWVPSIWVQVIRYGSWKGLKDEIPFLETIYKIPKVGGLYRFLTNNLPFCNRYFGHMIGFICLRV
jgi:hypothetical protein